MQPKFFSFLSGLTMRLPVFGPAPDRPAVEKLIEVDGHERRYRVLVPEAAQGALPVVVCLHGGGGNSAQMERYTQFDALAEKESFIVVYPESLGGNWNDGRASETIRAHRENIDDVGFMRRVLDEVAAQHDVDRTRVFSTGISNGGIMSHRLAADAADMIAAIAPVAGGIPAPMAAQFHPRHPVSVLIIQGDADPIVPFGGGEVRVGRSRRGMLIPTHETLSRYVAINHNPQQAATTTLDTDPADGISVEITRYPDGPGGMKTEFYLVRGGGHTWPGRPRYLPESTIGKASQDFSATEVIWSFFKSCPPRGQAAY